MLGSAYLILFLLLQGGETPELARAGFDWTTAVGVLIAIQHPGAHDADLRARRSSSGGSRRGGGTGGSGGGRRPPRVD